MSCGTHLWPTLCNFYFEFIEDLVIVVRTRLRNFTRFLKKYIYELLYCYSA